MNKVHMDNCKKAVTDRGARRCPLDVTSENARETKRSSGLGAAVISALPLARRVEHDNQGKNRRRVSNLKIWLAQLSPPPFSFGVLLLQLSLELLCVFEVALGLLLVVARAVHHLVDPLFAFRLVVIRFLGPCLATRHSGPLF